MCWVLLLSILKYVNNPSVTVVFFVSVSYFQCTGIYAPFDGCKLITLNVQSELSDSNLKCMFSFLTGHTWLTLLVTCAYLDIRTFDSIVDGTLIIGLVNCKYCIRLCQLVHILTLMMIMSVIDGTSTVELIVCIPIVALYFSII